MIGGVYENHRMFLMNKIVLNIMLRGRFYGVPVNRVFFKVIFTAICSIEYELIAFILLEPDSESLYIQSPAVEVVSDYLI
jgi:hypothetical protein